MSIHFRWDEDLAEYSRQSDENNEPKECREIAEISIKDASNAGACHESNSRKCLAKPDKLLTILRVLKRNEGIASCLHKCISNTLNEAESNVSIQVIPIIINILCETDP